MLTQSYRVQTNQFDKFENVSEILQSLFVDSFNYCPMASCVLVVSLDEFNKYLGCVMKKTHDININSH